MHILPVPYPLPPSTEESFYDENPITALSKEYEQFHDELKKAAVEGRYEECIRLVEEFEGVWQNRLSKELIEFIENELQIKAIGLSSCIQNLGDSCLHQMRAIFLGLANKTAALPLLDQGMKEMDLAFEKLRLIEEQLGWAGSITLRADAAPDQLDAYKNVMAGLIYFSLGERHEAAVHFRKIASLLSEDSTNLDGLFCLKLIEDKVGELILSSASSDTLVGQLFLQGKYEEALQASDEESFPDPSEKAILLASLGRYEEALALCDGFTTTKALIHMKQKEFEKAKEDLFEDGSWIFALSIIEGLKRS